MTDHVRAFKRLCLAIIEQAVEDYRQYAADGLICAGGVAGPGNAAWEIRMLRPNCRGRTKANEMLPMRNDAENLIRFFQPDGGCERLIASAHLDLDAEAIRNRLEHNA